MQEEGALLPMFGNKADDGIHLTDGKHRTLCVSMHLPDCLRRADRQWHLDQFELLDELYRGKTSLLHKAVDKASGVVVAIKQYRKKYLSALNRYQIEREVRIHINTQHVNIITLHAAFEDPEQVYLVQEFASGGDLFEALKHQPSMVFNETTAVARFMAPCLDAVAYLQDRGILHRDIKPENILLGESGGVKLADFGLAINCEQERPVTRAGTLDYMAPEILVCPDKRRPDENKDKASLSYGRQVDAWALGCLAAELVTGSPPFEADTRSATYQMIMYREPKLPGYLSTAAKSFIAASLAKNPSERSTVYQMLLHEWITSNRNAIVATDTSQSGLQPGTQASAGATTSSGDVTAQQQVVGGSSSGVGSSSVDTGGHSNAGSSVLSCSGASETSSLTTSAAGGTFSNPGAAATQLVGNSDTASTTAQLLDIAPAQLNSVEPAGLAPVLIAEGSYTAPGDMSTAASGSSAAVGGDSSALAGNEQAAVTGPAVETGPTGVAAADEVQAYAEPASQTEAGASIVSVTIPLAADRTATSPEASSIAVDSSAAADDAPRPMVTAEAASENIAADAAAAEEEPPAGSRHHRIAKANQHRASRASSIHGHRLHRVFYPHDKHRRSSYSNIQWDDMIDTASAHSFTSSIHSAAAGDSDDELAAAAAGGGGNGSALSADHDSSSDDDRSQTAELSTQRAVASPLRRKSSLFSRGVSHSATPDSSMFVQGSSNSFSGQGLGHVSRQASVLAALPDAEVQASAAVRSDVMAKTASGALHLLASNDLEDLIAPTVTPSRTLTNLGLSIPVDLGSGPASPGSLPTGRARITSMYTDGSRNESGPAVAAELLLNSSNFDDFIATSASPSVRIPRSFVIASSSSRSSSVPNLVALAAANAASSPSPGSEADGGRYSNISSLASPRTRHASLVGATSVPQHSGSSSSPPAGSRVRSTSAVTGSILAAAGSASDVSAGLAKSAVQNRSGVSLNLMTEGLDTDDDALGLRSETPNSSRRVIWADEAPTATPRAAVQAEALPRNSPQQAEAAASPSPRRQTAQSGPDSVSRLPAQAAQHQQSQYYTSPAGVLSADSKVGTRNRPAGSQQTAGSQAKTAIAADTSGGIGSHKHSVLPRSPSTTHKQTPAAASSAVHHHSSREAVTQSAAGGPFIEMSGRRRISSSDGGASSHASQHASRRSSSEGGAADKQHHQTGMRSSSSSVAADKRHPSIGPFTVAVPFAALGSVLGLDRNSINSRTLPSQLQLPTGSDSLDGSAEADMNGLVAARRTSKSFTAGVPGVGQPAAGRRSSGALTPTKTNVTGSILGGANLKDASLRSKSAVDMAASIL